MFVSQSHFPPLVLWLWLSADFRAVGPRQSCVSVGKAAEAASAVLRLGW